MLPDMIAAGPYRIGHSSQVKSSSLLLIIVRRIHYVVKGCTNLSALLFVTDGTKCVTVPLYCETGRSVVGVNQSWSASM